MNGDLVIAVIDAIQNNIGRIDDVRIFEEQMYADGKTKPSEDFHLTISFEKKENENA